MAVLKDVKRLVVKVGTSTLVYVNGKTNIRRMHKLISVLSDIENSGIKVTLVSSGAIGVGTGKLGLPERPKDTPGRQAAAFYTLGTGLRVPNESGAKIRLLKRSALDNITDKLIDHSKNYKSGISLAALSCTAYSDYAEARYYRKG